MTRGLLAVGGVALGLFALSRVGAIHSRVWDPQWLTDSLYLGANGIAAGLCLARAWRVNDARLAWGLLGAGMLASGAASAHSFIVLRDQAEPSYPSLSDAGWITFNVLLVVALMLLARERVRGFRTALWIDAALALLTLAALVVALVYEPLLAATGSEPSAIITALTYPILDVVLIATAVGFLALSGWRLDATWALLIGAACLQGVGDLIYVRQVATGAYEPGGALDAVYPAVMLLIAAAAWTPTAPGRTLVELRDRSMVAVPLTFTAIAVALLSYGGFVRLPLGATLLATLALGCALMRMVAEFRRQQTLGVQARTDPLTGLLNQREYHAMLALQIHRARERADEGRFSVAMFALEGLKALNDRRGHVEGDRILRAIAQAIELESRASDQTARLGGGVFALLMPRTPGREAVTVAERIANATAEVGAGVEIFYGVAEWPTDGPDKDMLLLRADVALHYARKQAADAAHAEPDHPVTSIERLERKLGSAGAGPSDDATQRAARDAHPAAGHASQRSLIVARDSAHFSTVLALAATAAAGHTDFAEHIERSYELGLLLAREAIPDEAEDPQLAYGFLLHDIGKAAIPPTILSKPGPLDARELALIRRHPQIGCELISALPFLTRAIDIVLYHHERWDGGGYPEGLAGERIPVGARVFAVADAVDAMTSERPYRRAMSLEAARAEVVRGSGSQFDPEIVSAFERLDPRAVEHALRQFGGVRLALTGRPRATGAAGIAP